VKLFGVLVETTPHETEKTPPPPFTTVPFIDYFNYSKNRKD
jgi:hypothetical protein